MALGSWVAESFGFERRVQGLGFIGSRVQGLGSRVQGLGLRWP